MSVSFTPTAPVSSDSCATILVRDSLANDYWDILSKEVLDTLEHMSQFEPWRRQLLQERYSRRRERFEKAERIDFLDARGIIPGTDIKVKDARAGKFAGAEIPGDLQRQWVQGTGPGAKPNATLEQSLRNVAYALLSGADGWMFDGEDALGQITTMSLDNQRNLKLAIAGDPIFLKIAEQVATEMNAWAKDFHGHEIIENWREQLAFTTKIFRCRGLHLDDRHFCTTDGSALGASITDLTLYIVNNYRNLMLAGASLVLYLPKIQTAEEAAYWNTLLHAIESYLGLSIGTIKAYVLVEQLETTYQLMEIRAALGVHFVGFNTGRWDYINSVSDAMAWDEDFLNPNIESITMTYGYMRIYEDRVRRAVNTPDQNGNYALWQGGMEPNIPVGSAQGVAASMEKAVAGARRECAEGASGKWVAHWKMVHIIRPVWEETGADNQLGREFPPLTYTKKDAAELLLIEEAPRTIRGARNLLSVALQYGNAFGQGFQAAALKPADFFGDDDVLYLMEDMATGEIRMSILWEWIHKGATLTEDDAETGMKAGDTFSMDLYHRLLAEEYAKLLAADNRNVHDDSKDTTLPIVREIVEAYMLCPEKLPWYIDLLNINLNNHDLPKARQRIRRFVETFLKEDTRLTGNPDFVPGREAPAVYESEMEALEHDRREMEAWMNSPRFSEITRLHTPRQVAEQRGSLHASYPVATEAAKAFHQRLRELFDEKKSTTTFGPYSPGQAVTMKRIGIEGIYLGGWATSAKGSADEDPGPDLASYPLSQVPNEAANIVRALLTADKNQHYARSRMTEEERRNTPKHDYRPFIIADADTGHGGEAHVRNLVRRFVEVGVTGYHIEDQKPGCKKCGHQGGKVLVPQDEMNKRLNAARLQLDIMKVPGIIVARTDAEAATLLDARGDERDQPFILGATNTKLPAYKETVLSVHRHFFEGGVKEVRGHMLYQLSDTAYNKAVEWMCEQGVLDVVEKEIQGCNKVYGIAVEQALDRAISKTHATWENEARLKTFAEAVAEVMQFHVDEGDTFEMTVPAWLEWAGQVSQHEARDRARAMGISIIWDCEMARTPEGYYQVRGGIEYAIVKSLASAPYADLLWMETKTANLEDARRFAEAIHARYPRKMLAYNLSPSFNWDTTGMTDEEMRQFPHELGKLGYVFNFITYGGHQIDGLAAEEFATALCEDGMLALARLQRKLRLLNSPYKTPQTLAGGPRVDGALVASSGRTATTKAMGKGSTQFQHLVQTEVPVKLLDQWMALWTTHYRVPRPMQAVLRPHTAGSDLLELIVQTEAEDRVGNIVFAPIQDRRGRRFLSMRDENIVDPAMRQKRLMTLMHLFLIHRYRVNTVHYVSPNEENHKQALKMKELHIYSDVTTEIGQIIVANVDETYLKLLLDPDGIELNHLITKQALASA